MSKTKAAALQMVSTDRLEDNLAVLDQLLAQAAANDVKLAVLPENFALFSSAKLRAAGALEVSDAGPIRSFVAAAAQRHGLWLVAGSLPVAARPDGMPLAQRVRSACFVYDDQGNEVARYDKIHLFDVDVQDSFGRYRESDTIEPGDQLVLVDTPCGRLGLSICYDLRFPELYRALSAQGAEIFAVPAAFTAVTGAAHWQVLLRARAIENLCYVIAADQGGRHSATRETYGHSMLVDPWGQVLAYQETGEGLVMAEMDLDYLHEVRAQMPVLQHQRWPIKA